MPYDWRSEKSVRISLCKVVARALLINHVCSAKDNHFYKSDDFRKAFQCRLGERRCEFDGQLCKYWSSIIQLHGFQLRFALHAKQRLVFSSVNFLLAINEL